MVSGTHLITQTATQLVQYNGCTVFAVFLPDAPHLVHYDTPRTMANNDKTDERPAPRTPTRGSNPTPRTPPKRPKKTTKSPARTSPKRKRKDVRLEVSAPMDEIDLEVGCLEPSGARASMTVRRVLTRAEKRRLPAHEIDRRCVIPFKPEDLHALRIQGETKQMFAYGA